MGSPLFPLNRVEFNRSKEEGYQYSGYSHYFLFGRNRLHSHLYYPNLAGLVVVESIRLFRQVPAGHQYHLLVVGLVECTPLVVMRGVPAGMFRDRGLRCDPLPHPHYHWRQDLHPDPWGWGLGSVGEVSPRVADPAAALLEADPAAAC